VKKSHRDWTPPMSVWYIYTGQHGQVNIINKRSIQLHLGGLCRISQLFPSDESSSFFIPAINVKCPSISRVVAKIKKSIIPDDPVMFFCAGTRKKMAIFILKCERKNFQTFSPVEVDRTWSSPPPQTCARLRSSVPSKSFHSHTHTRQHTLGKGRRKKTGGLFWDNLDDFQSRPMG
jgi:hypothetical protein